MKTIKCELTVASLDAAIRELEKYRDDLERKAGEICERLANLGFETIFTILAQHVYSGETISNLQVREISPTKYEILDGSVALLFLEFGAGLNGGGHPQAKEFGMGPGTYPPTNPDNPQWNNPNGWWFPTEDRNLAVRWDDKKNIGWGHSYGNPPYMPFWNAAQDMRSQILTIAREVFGT